MQNGFLSPMLRQPGTPWMLRNGRTGDVLARRLLPAFDSATRRKGLLGREGLPEGEAMIIAPTNAIHTIRMRFPIDVLFVDRRGCVLNVRRALAPWRMAASLRGFAVVELPAGTVDGCPTQPGDVLVIEAAG